MRLVVLIVLSAVLLSNALPASAEKTNKIIVKLKPQVSVELIRATHPFAKFERASTLPRVFIFSVQNINSVDEETNNFLSDDRVAWAHVDEIHDDELMSMPTDPSLLSGDQWFHNHINSSYAWSKGFSGQGQLVQVIDSPVFPNERDLVNQLDFGMSFEGDIPSPPLRAGTHGTVCTNLIVAEANDFCGVGVAFSARAAVFPFIEHPIRRFSDIDFAEAFGTGFPVSSNSFGPNICNIRGCNIAPGFVPVMADALELAQDRNNTVFVFASGNQGANQGSPNFGRFGSTPRIIMVGATRYNGMRAGYSNVGPANWIVAPAGDHRENVTWTSTVANNQQNCGGVGVGTSWSAPMVSGAAAILRSAYPSLTWRDVKLILAYSADRTDIEHASWIKNGAGRWFSNHYGFGQLNVGNAVEVGASWKAVGPLQIRTFHASFERIPFNWNNIVASVSVAVPIGIISRIESVQITLHLTATGRGNFQIDLISPSGTPCNIFAFRRDNNRNYNNFVTSANCFLDEDPAGQWTFNVTRNVRSFQPESLNSFSLTVWGETAPSQVKLLAPSTAARMSSFTVKEGDTFQQLVLFHDFPATIGLFWKDTFGLYGELFTTQGKQTTGTQRLNPSNSDHPTISVFYGGDHVLTYLENIDGAVVMQAEVRNINFIPLTPLTVLPFDNMSPEYITVAAIESSIVVSYRSTVDSYTKLALLNVDFGSRDTTPLCVPYLNYTTEAEADDAFLDENNCTEIIYRRDGKISLLKQAEIITQSQVVLHSIGMNLVLGTWNDGQAINAALIRSDLTMNITILQAPVTSVVRAAATPQDVFIAFSHSQGVDVKRYDMNMVLHESFILSTNEPVVAVNLAYTHVEGLSLVIATSHNVSVTTWLRSYDRTFVQTNQATIASMLSENVPVLDIDQSVMPNGDLVVTFSTIQEIHVQVFDKSIFGVAPLPPMTPVDVTVPEYTSTPTYNVPMTQQTPEELLVDDLEKQFPSWAIALIVIGSLLALFFAVVFIVARQKKRRSQSRFIGQQDPDLISYTKMNV